MRITHLDQKCLLLKLFKKMGLRCDVIIVTLRLFRAKGYHLHVNSFYEYDSQNMEVKLMTSLKHLTKSYKAF